MVRMGDVWDRTTQVLSGRGGALATIAALTIFLPSVVSAGFTAYAGKANAETSAIGGLIGIVVALIAIWGQLVLIALSSDPATTTDGANAIARGRLLPAIGVALAIGVVFGVLLVPILVAVAATGLTPEMMQAGVMPTITPGIALFLALYGLAFLLFFLFFSARMALWTPVVVNERRGLGAIRRSFALTRGITFRVIGVVLLYLIVLLVAAGAARSVTGVVFGLILGHDAVATVTFLAAIAGSVVATALAVVAAVFTAQLYVATSGFRGGAGLAQRAE